MKWSDSRGVPMERICIFAFFLPTNRPDGTKTTKNVPSGHLVGRKPAKYQFHVPSDRLVIAQLLLNAILAG